MNSCNVIPGFKFQLLRKKEHTIINGIMRGFHEMLTKGTAILDCKVGVVKVPESDLRWTFL